MRTLLIALAAVVAAIVAAVLLAPAFVDGDDLKRRLATEIEAATGRALAIDGEVSVELLPTPALEVAGVRLANTAGAAMPDMVRSRALRVEVALWPLLSSRVEVRRLILVEPTVELEQRADGGANWNFDPPAKPIGPAAGDADARPADAEKGFAGQLDNVQITRGTVVWRRDGDVRRFERIEALVSAVSLDGPFRFDGKLSVGGLPVDTKVSVGQLRVDRAAPVSVNVTAAGATGEIQGLLSGWPVALKLTGRLAMRAPDPAVVAAVTGLGALPPVVGATALEIDAQIVAGAEAVAINDMTLRFGGLGGSGAIDLALGDRPAANVVLNLARVDLDGLLATHVAPPASSAASAQGAPRQLAQHSPMNRPLPALPKYFDATVELKVDAITWRGAVIRQTQVVASLAAGDLTLSQATALLPGSSDVSAFGFVTLGESGPAFDGQVEANSDNLRALLAWLGTDVGDVPAERLRKLALAATVKATGTDLTLTDIDMTIDTSRIRGGVAVALRDRPGFGIGLSVDRVNFDAYQPDRAIAVSAGVTPAPAGSTAARTGPVDQSGPLAVLDRFDAIVQMKAGALTWNGQQYSGLSLDGTLQGGALELRDASVADVAGASVRLTGMLSGVDTGAQQADVDLAVKAPDPDRLARALGTTLPLPLGAAELDVGLRGSLAAGADIDGKLIARGAEATVKGRVGDLLTAAPSLDLAFALNHPDGGRLLGALSGTAMAEGGGALKFSGTAKGTPATLDLNTTLGLGDARLAAAGHLAGLPQGAPAGSLRVTASHPDFAAAARMLAPGWRLALARPGALKLVAEVKLAPGRIDVGAIDGEFGPVKLAGQAAWDTTGPRPKLSADLQTSEVVLDWFLAPVAPAGATGGGVAAAPGAATGATKGGDDGERWPRTAIDFGPLRSFDAALTLTAPTASQGDLRIDTPKVVATLSDGVFDLRELTGKVYGGTLAMHAHIDARAAPVAVSANLRIAGANAAAMADAGHGGGARTMGGLLELIFPVSAVSLTSGTLGADFNVDSRGASPFELVSNLSGKVGVSFVDAVVSGIDACRVSKQLDSIKGLQGFLDLAGSTRGGQTRIGNFQTSFGIARGVAVLPEQTITADCSSVAVKGSVDLPRWLVDMQTRARLTEHRNFPGVLVEEKGSLDQPNIRVVNINEIQQYVAGKGVETIIRNLAPGQQQAPQQQAPRQQAPQQQAPQQAPQQPQRPADRFNDILQDFLKTPR